MNRRNAIKNASLVLGYTLSVPAIIGILNGCKPEPKMPDWAPKFVKKEQLNMLKAFADRIIPKTDSPAASEVGVVEFIDEMLSGCLGPEEQKLFTDGIARMQTMAGEKSFDQLAAAERDKILNQLDQEAFESLKSKKPEEIFFTSAKGLIVTGYMLSEKIGTEYLAYDPSPGNYDGCIPLEQNGGVNWSL